MTSVHIPPGRALPLVSPGSSVFSSAGGEKQSRVSGFGGDPPPHCHPVISEPGGSNVMDRHPALTRRLLEDHVMDDTRDPYLWKRARPTDRSLGGGVLVNGY